MTGYRADPGSGSGTDWTAYDVPAMWSMIEDFDVAPQWRHVGGWRKAIELAERHLSRMRAYRDRLATSWPPSPGSASSVYLGELDQLIASVQATYESAAANYGVMSAATQAIADVRDELQPLYERWRSNESTMAAFEAAVSATRSGLPAPVPGPPPLSPRWRDELNAQARGVMETASSELALASLRIVTPPGYVAPRPISDPGQDRPSAGGIVAFISPPIPPVTTKSSRGARTRGTAAATVRMLPDRPSISALTGQRAMPSSRGDTPARGVVGGARPGPVVRTIEPGGSMLDRPKQQAVSPSDTRPSPRPVSPGVIGLQPGLAHANHPARRTQHVSPIGGVIGGNPPPRPAKSGGGATGPAAAFGPRRFRTPEGHVVTITGRAVSGESAETERDPDDPWATSSGVPPVVEPKRQQSAHDPGPAIGLH